jgi:serine phosphatase RsbU (regulator of sigma subunit)
MLWVPLLDGTERLGVVEFRFPGGEPGDVLADCLDVADLVAELVMTRRAYGDLVEKTRRRERMTLPAEIQWLQLPPLTFRTPRIGISGVLMPTAEVAGDSFDYAVNDAVAHVAIIDGMGHGLEATLLATVAVGALRHSRRLELTLLETVAAMDHVIAEQFGPDKFVTGLVGELALDTGMWSWITCGHPPALLVREGRVVKTLEAAISPPLGLHFAVPEPGTERLQPGDQLLLYSDGVIEGRAETGEFFGTERLVEFITKQAAAGRPAAETLRRLNLAILDHQAGQLQDDVTTVLVEWLGDEPASVGPASASVEGGAPARP